MILAVAADLHLPAAITARMRVRAAPPEFATPQATMWLVDVEGQLAVLRRDDPARLPATEENVAGVEWVIDALGDLATTGFPAPRPIPVFDGRSWAVVEDAIWQLLSYLPGRIVGWRTKPTLRQLGRLLGDLHRAAERVPPRLQRPNGFALDGLSAVVRRATVERDHRRWLVDLAEALESELSTASTRRFVHGDPTAHNMLASGEPLAPTGIIDFHLAHVGPPISDVAFALWRTGRAAQDDTEFDFARVAEFVSGYASTRTIADEHIPVLVACLWGRGLQMEVKRAARGFAPAGTRPRIEWIRSNVAGLRDAVTQGVATHE